MTTSSDSSSSDSSPSTTGPSTVLFLCPHGAGKSLVAATYFRAAAGRLGLDMTIRVAGPDPDAENMPNVTAALQNQGFAIGWSPKLLDAGDTESADVVVDIGCGLASADGRGSWRSWDVPLLSEDFDASMRAIHRHAEELAVELAQAAEVHSS